jgi:type IV pilus assembly protein PilN
MIRINLLPVRELRKKASLQRQGMMLGVAAGMGAVLALCVHLKLGADVVAGQRRLQGARAELAKLEEMRKKVDEFRAEREAIERKLKVIADLEKARKAPVRLLDEIATRIPRRMWLRKVALDRGELALEGVSLDAEIVAAFLTSLEESPLISEVELGETALKETDGLKLNTFQIDSRYVHAGSAEPRAAKGAGAARPPAGRPQAHAK